MSSSTSTKKMITLISSDDAKFEVEESVVSISQTIKNMIEDDCTDNGIPLLNVTGATLAKVIEYCKKHAENSAAPADETEGSSSSDAPVAAASNDEELKNWDAEFVKVDHAGLFDLILAANYLNIKSLLDLACQTEADTIKNFTPEQIRQRYHIVNDFTPEEEEKIRQENAWAFD